MSVSDPDFEGAVAYALGRLTVELPNCYVYHSVVHTRDEVLPAVERLATASNISGRDFGLLRVAAAFHDIGFIYRAQGHEICGVRIAAQVLPGFGFDDEAIESILGMILATRLPQSPRNLMEELLADADLDALRRDDFLERNAALEQEMERLGRGVEPAQWYADQLAFMRGHSYFTAAAQELCGPGKARNLRRLETRLAAATKSRR